MRSISLASIAMFFIYCMNLAAAESPLRALVIGNSAYAAKPLANPVNDAKLIGETLKQIGFEVTQANDLGTRKAFFEVVRNFYEKLPAGSVAFVYYAGHGMQINRVNYLLPVSETFKSERDVEAKAYSLEMLQQHLEQKKGGAIINILVFDACRDNPFQFKNGKYRGLDNLGFVEMIAPKQTLVAFSTAPGEPAEDGLGDKNSLYSKTLADELKRPGITIETALKNVARIVRTKTHDDQRPWVDSSLVSDVYLKPSEGKPIIAQKLDVGKAKLDRAIASRGMDGDVNDQEWFMRMSEFEWTQLDRDIQKRVQYLTEDELPLIKKRASSGNVIAMTTLGLASRDGVSKMTEANTNRVFRLKSNNTLAVKYLKQAANLGFPVAQTELGEMLFTGIGLDKDLRGAIQWFERASQANYPRAKIDLWQAKISQNPSEIGALNVEMTTDMSMAMQGLVTSYIPEGPRSFATAAKANNTQQSDCDMHNMAGIWQVTFWQEMTKTKSSLTLELFKNKLIGTSTEKDPRPGGSGNVDVNWMGMVKDKKIRLTKAYIFEGSVPVVFEGSCSELDSKINGKWAIKYNAVGPFTMQKLN